MITSDIFHHCTYCATPIHEEDSEGNKRFDFKTVRKYYEDHKEVIIPVCDRCIAEMIKRKEVIKIVVMRGSAKAGYDLINNVNLTDKQKEEGIRFT